MNPGPAAPPLLLVRAAALADGTGLGCVPAAILLGPGSTPGSPAHVVLAVGTPDQVRAHPAAGHAATLDLPDCLLMPGLVNAHVHADLTHVGPQPHDPTRGFVPWIEMVRARRADDPAEIADAVRQAAALLRAGGTVAVGDIVHVPRIGRGGSAGTDAPGRSDGLAAWRVFRESQFAGVSYLEFFGIGRGEERGRAGMERFLNDHASTLAEALAAPLRLGLQPHAPYSVSVDNYLAAVRWSRRLGLPLATHAAESPEERMLVREGTGPLADLLRRLHLWDETLPARVRAPSPLQLLAPALAETPCLLAHVHDADDDDIALLARTGACVAYCPRAGAYFDAPAHFGPHRYRDMLAAGVCVALGTDSIIVLPATACTPATGGISILDEMRWLFAGDQTDPWVLLRMGTLHGARALGLDPRGFRLGVGASPLGLVAVPFRSPRQTSIASSREALCQVLQTAAPPRLVLARACDTHPLRRLGGSLHWSRAV